MAVEIDFDYGEAIKIMPSLLLTGQCRFGWEPDNHLKAKPVLKYTVLF